MTNYKVVGYDTDGEPLSVIEAKAETAGLAVIGACAEWGKAPPRVKVWAWHKERGKESWLECYLAPDFRKILATLYPANGDQSDLQSA